MKLIQESVLTDCLDRLESGAAVADILARYPDVADELAPFLATAVTLTTLAPSPSPTAQAHSRERFLAAAAALRPPRCAPASGASPAAPEYPVNLPNS